MTRIRKYYRKVRDYETAHQEGNKAGEEVENAVKKYKSHRRVLRRIFDFPCIELPLNGMGKCYMYIHVGIEERISNCQCV